MHFARTEEQDELAAIVGSMLDKRSGSEAVRTASASEPGYDETLWQALCGQVGVAALPVPEEYDGFGASLVETAAVLEELGRRLTPSPLLATSIATTALLLCDPRVDAAALLSRVATGEIATVALDGPILDGPVLDAADAAIHLRVRDGNLVLVAGPDVEPVECIDQTVRLGRVSGGAETTLGSIDEALLRAVAAALTSAAQVGTAQLGLDLTVAYSQEREQFGRPIGSFQALKHRMADMLVLVEASRSASWGATAAAAAYVEEPTEERAAVLLRRSAVARSYCSDALDHVASETVQLHGGIAITWEHDAQLVFKRAHVLSRLWEPAHVARASVLGVTPG